MKRLNKFVTQQRFRKTVPKKSEQIPARLGDGSGNVLIDDMPGYVYARVAGRVERVYNDRVPASDDLAVWVGRETQRYPDAPERFQVISTQSYAPGGAGNPVQVGYAPAIRYEIFAPGGGQDPLHVQMRQTMWLGVFPSSGMTIRLQPGIIYPPGGAVWVASQTADMTSHVPATTGKAALVLITVNTSGTLVATKGSEFTLADMTTPALMLANLPATPASTAWVAGAVRVMNGQTAINESRVNTDVIDLRWTAANIYLTSPDIISDTAYGSGWNGDTTHAPTKNAVYDKIETLAPLTAIDDTVYGAGWDGDTTHAPTKNAVYDKINSMSASGLTIQEVDGSPTGTPGTLKMPNGSLTDNGDGSFSFAPAGGGNVSDTGSTTANHLAVWNGTNDHTIKDGGAIPSGFWGTVLLDSTVGAGGAADFDLNSIASGYKKIEILLSARADAVQASVMMAFNNDTTAGNYSRIWQYATSSSTRYSDVVAENRIGYAAPSNATANRFAMNKITIFDYDSGFHKMAICEAIYPPDTNYYAAWFHMLWANTAAITRITLTIASANFAQYSHCLIVGYKTY